MARTWKYVGGDSSMPRNSLQSAVKAILDGEVVGARAIYNTETGELYDLLGTPHPSLSAAQYQQIVHVLGVVFVHLFHDIPLSKEVLLPLLSQVGDPVASQVKTAATEYAVAMASFLQDKEQELNGEGGSIPS